jgi:1,2-dihydroxy-3-keto-5-methylthiopentene dioxygenase
MTQLGALMLMYTCDNQGDQREPHDSGRAVSEEKLASLGVLYHHCPTIEAVDAIAKERGYKNRDQVCVSPQAMGDVYEDKVKMFFAEHLHEDEEIRYILDGEGYFDVRGQEDEWIRIDLVKDDMIILPAGIYHRFTTDEQNVCDFAGLIPGTNSFFGSCLADLLCFTVRQGYAPVPG